MGIVYIDGVTIGSFTPDTEGTSGSVYLDSEVIGSFTLNISGFIYIDGVSIGWYSATSAGTGVAVGLTYLIYPEKLFEIRVYLSGGTDYYYTRFGLLDADWGEADPWVTLKIPKGTPVSQHLGVRNIEDGVLHCRDDNAVFVLFRSIDVRADTGNQYLIGETSYAASKVVFVYKATKVTVSTGVEEEDTIYYTFSNFRIGKTGFPLGMENQGIWELMFNADSVIRSEP